MTFIGPYADLTGFRIGDFEVVKLAGRDSAKAPLWRVKCRVCKKEQVFKHATLTVRVESRCAAETLFCQNQRCRLSRREPVHTQTLRDVRIRERKERDQAEQQAAEDQSRAAKARADVQAREAALKLLRESHHRYVIHQINAGVPAEEIASLGRWLKIDGELRAKILERIAHDNSVRVRGLTR